MRYQICILALPAILAARTTTAAPGRPAAGTSTTLALLETSDLHANVPGFDYCKLAPDASFGPHRHAHAASRRSWGARCGTGRPTLGRN